MRVRDTRKERRAENKGKRLSPHLLKRKGTERERKGGRKDTGKIKRRDEKKVKK